MLTQEEFLKGVYELAKNPPASGKKRMWVIVVAAAILLCTAWVVWSQNQEQYSVKMVAAISSDSASGSSVPWKGMEGVVCSADLIVSGNREEDGFLVTQCYKGQCSSTLELNTTSQKMIPMEKTVVLFLEQDSQGKTTLLDTPNHVLVYDSGTGEDAQYQLSDGSVITIEKLEQWIDDTESDIH
ncbi:MAG: hypothetical protein ACOX60_12465 [Massiliimalia sp.]|jgi:hypothetical protein